MEGYYGICVAYIANYPIKNKALVKTVGPAMDPRQSFRTVQMYCKLPYHER